MTDEVREKYLKAVDIICEQFGLNKPNQIIYVCEALENLIEPYMKENKALGERVLQLEKDKGKLIDEYRELKANQCCNMSDKGLCLADDRLQIVLDENAELKAQNENKREEIKMLRNEHKQDMLIHNNYVNKVEELKAQIEKMKCCGNCINYDNDNNLCNKIHRYSHECCKEWEWEK